MLHLAIIYHMHQPYYQNLLTGEVPLPWVRLHGIKDYLDMVQMLDKYPGIKLTFNLVPSLIEQIDDFIKGSARDKFLELSLKPAEVLNGEEKKFILANFFSISKERVISLFPRYYELYFKKKAGINFNTRDYLDLQVWFNLSWFDPLFRDNIAGLKNLVEKGRFFSEEDKQLCLKEQTEILKQITPAYKKFQDNRQVEVTTSPYYHPILPLLYNTKIAREADIKTVLPREQFSYPEDVRAQIESAFGFYREKFGVPPVGMWPSEESVSEHILPYIRASGINWIVADEAILFKSLNKKRRDARLIYQPYLLKREEGSLNIVFRDRNLSDLISFVYHRRDAKDAVADFMRHLEDTRRAFSDGDILVTVAMDGENAWEYFANDGHEFLELLYQRLSESSFIKTTTVSEYLKTHPPKKNIKRLAAGSWIYGNFGKWIGNPSKVRAWEWLAQARGELEKLTSVLPEEKLRQARKQIYIAEGSDWFWWYGEDPDGSFDRLFRMHLTNFYAIIDKPAPNFS